MSEAARRPLWLDFNRRLKVEFRIATITSGAGLLTFRVLGTVLVALVVAGLACQPTDALTRSASTGRSPPAVKFLWGVPICGILRRVSLLTFSRGLLLCLGLLFGVLRRST